MMKKSHSYLPCFHALAVAVQAGSPSAVATGPSGTYFVSEDRRQFHLRGKSKAGG